MDKPMTQWPPLNAVCLMAAWANSWQLRGHTEQEVAGAEALRCPGACSNGMPRLVLLSLMLGTALERYDSSVLAQLDAPLSQAFFPPHASAEVSVLVAAPAVARP